MEKINWFPGHMKKALSMMADEVIKTDVLIYVLDGRAPLACLNPEFLNIINNKPVLFIINKLDLSDEKKLLEIKKVLKTDNNDVVLLNSTASGSSKIVIDKLQNLCRITIEKYIKKGIKPIVRAMVVGVPNCGKSTFINNLIGKYKAVTGNKPGVTKNKQWIKVSENMEILDTPGTLWPNISDQTAGKKLAFIGSIKDEIVSSDELALMLIDELKVSYEKYLDERFSVLSRNKNALEILEEISIKRGYLLKRGEPDYIRTGKAIIDDFRKGKIGRITL